MDLQPLRIHHAPSGASACMGRVSNDGQGRRKRQADGNPMRTMRMVVTLLFVFVVALFSCPCAARLLTPPDPALYAPVNGLLPGNVLSAGVTVDKGFFGATAPGVQRTSLCTLPFALWFNYPDGSTFPANELFQCADDPVDANVCLTKQEIIDAFAGQPDVLASLYSRYDLPPVHIESQSSNSNQFTTEVFALLAQEVGGYRVKHTLNPTFGTLLFRCTGNQFDFHAEIWRTDWSDDQWNGAFLGTDPDTPQTCNYNGINGQTIFNGWFVDTYSVMTAASNATVLGGQPTSLDFWRAYTTAEGVQNLPQFNITQARIDIAARDPKDPIAWQWPDWCDPNVTASVPCGVIYPIAPFFEKGVVIAQIRTLGLRLAVFYAASFDDFYNLVIPRVKNREQVLCMLGNNAGLVANDYFQHVMLPAVTPECIAAVAAEHVDEYYCDMRSQVLSKINNRALAANSDYNDVSTLFSRMQFSSQIIFDALTKITPTNKPVDQACTWIKQNPKLWTPWFGVTTPRVHTIQLTSGVDVAIIALSSIFMVCTIAGMVFLFLYRQHPIIRRASHLFCQFMLAGAALFYATLIVGVQKESLATCTAAQFMFSVAFTLFYGSLLVKTWRIYLIFNSKALEVQKLTNSTMSLYLLTYGAVDLLLVILWAGISPPTATLHDHSTAAYTQVTLCDSEHSVVFSTALYVWRGLAVLAGGVLAVRIRGVDDDFSESKFLGAACYNILGVSIVVLGLTLVGSRAPDVAVISWLIGVTLAVFLSSLIFLVPKWQGVFGTQTKVRNTIGGGVRHATRDSGPGVTQHSSGHGSSSPKVTGGVVVAASRGQGASGGTPGSPHAATVKMHLGRPSQLTSTPTNAVASPVSALAGENNNHHHLSTAPGSPQPQQDPRSSSHEGAASTGVESEVA
jgi:hypothetical protein